jgi:hypothetical protein
VLGGAVEVEKMKNAIGPWDEKIPYKLGYTLWFFNGLL